MYVTSRGMRTSAPPHTDRQDVVAIQTEGAKRWRVFGPPTDGDAKPNADPFARGKGEDSLPLHTLLEGKEGRLGSELLLDVVTREGDVLFIPAGELSNIYPWRDIMFMCVLDLLFAKQPPKQAFRTRPTPSKKQPMSIMIHQFI